MMQVPVEIRRGTDRYLTRGEGYFTRHSFAFGAHYDPANVRFGRLVCHDDHRLKAGTGFPLHEHRDVHVVTWVLTGSLRHTHVAGGAGGAEAHESTLRRDEIQVLSAGSGVQHAEIGGPEGQVRFIQAWIAAEEPGAAPSHDARPVDLEPGRLSEVLSLGDATLLVARLEAGQTVTLPDAPLQHVFVAGGALARFSLAEPLADGDALRITDDPGHHVTAAVPTELMVWTFAGR